MMDTKTAILLQKYLALEEDLGLDLAVIAFKNNCYNLAAQCLLGSNPELSSLAFSDIQAKQEHDYLIRNDIVTAIPVMDGFGQLQFYNND